MSEAARVLSDLIFVGLGMILAVALLYAREPRVLARAPPRQPSPEVRRS